MLSEIAQRPTTSTFAANLSRRAAEIDSLLCVGLDPILSKMPDTIGKDADGVVEFCREIIQATSDFALAYKPNLGFFVGLGRSGLDALYRVCADIPPGIPILLDCKVNDMGATAEHYARGWFDELQVDAITVAPYMGEDAIEPYLRDARRGVFILAKTSNSGSGQIQDRQLATGENLYLEVARLSNQWNTTYPASVGLVVGATYSETFVAIRQQAPDLWILVPGIGEQGGSLQDSLTAGLNASGDGILASASRSVLYAGENANFANASGRAAADLVSQIRTVRRSLSF